MRTVTLRCAEMWRKTRWVVVPILIGTLGCSGGSRPEASIGATSTGNVRETQRLEVPTSWPRLAEFRRSVVSMAQLQSSLPAQHLEYLLSETVAPFTVHSLDPLYNDRQRQPKCSPQGCPSVDDYGAKIRFVRYDWGSWSDLEFAQGFPLLVGFFDVSEVMDGYQPGIEYQVGLKRDPASGDWTAEIGPVNGPVTTGIPVRRIGGTAPHATLVEWEQGNRRTVLGARCGSGWCWFRLTALPASRPSPNHSCPDNRVTWSTCGTPGWKDKQILAERNPGGHLKRTGPDAQIIPRPGLDRILPTMDTTGWVLVGAIHASKDYAKTVRDASSNPVFDFEIRKGLSQVLLLGTPGNANPQYVVGAVVHEGGSVQYLRLERFQHAGVPVAARWQWRPDDEGIWTPCGPGCCELSAFRQPQPGFGSAAWQPF